MVLCLQASVRLQGVSICIVGVLHVADSVVPSCQWAATGSRFWLGERHSFTCARMSLMPSLAAALPVPSTRSRRSTCAPTTGIVDQEPSVAHATG